jgi:splicing factor 3B subunit 1
VLAREWMRICFELLDLLKAHKKGIRRAAVNSFGYIAKSLGLQDVHSVLLTNLRVQERRSRVCSTVAIAIVAETCGPFTCIPAILNEYRTAELNVRTGCLKALTFVFELHRPPVGVLLRLRGYHARRCSHRPRSCPSSNRQRYHEAHRSWCCGYGV